MQCRKCVLAENRPDVWINEDGVCNFCVDFEKRKGVKDTAPLLESELIKILNKHKGKKKYDCLLMCSGGKDSVMSLYYMTKRYKLNPIVFTFDHGFENNEAVENVKNAVNILNVDWMYFKTDFMKRVFKIAIETETKAPLCHICAIWYMDLTFDVASRYDVPLIIGGWTKGQVMELYEKGQEYYSMSRATAEFVENHLRTIPEYKHFPRSMKEVVKNANRKGKRDVLSPHWFLHYTEEKKMEILNNELKWKAPELSYPAHTTNCLMNFLSVYFSLKHFGYTHYHIEMSKLIRLGQLSRDEALDMLQFNYDKTFLNKIAKEVSCTILK